jgi:aryl-alcohol dehydrogenase-like predicted oxidoreductase
MRTTTLGPGTTDVSIVGFGGWPLSDSPARPSEAEAMRVIHAALDGGATLIDTADAYCLHQGEVGHNERLVAKALASWSGPRDEVVVATKGGYVRPDGRWENNARPEHLRQACDLSLRALGVERIDLYQLHGPDPAVSLAESVGMMAELQRAGKVRWLGLSNVSVEEIVLAREQIEVVSVQNRLNPFFREAGRDGVVAYCDGEGLGFLAYSPVGGGRLNKKLPQIPVLGPIARRHGVSPHAVVLAWVLAQGESVLVIPAARSEAHLRDSQAAADVELSQAEIEAITAAEFSTA